MVRFTLPSFAFMTLAVLAIASSGANSAAHSAPPANAVNSIGAAINTPAASAPVIMHAPAHDAPAVIAAPQQHTPVLPNAAASKCRQQVPNGAPQAGRPEEMTQMLLMFPCSEEECTKGMTPQQKQEFKRECQQFQQSQQFQQFQQNQKFQQNQQNQKFQQPGIVPAGNSRIATPAAGKRHEPQQAVRLDSAHGAAPPAKSAHINQRIAAMSARTPANGKPRLMEKQLAGVLARTFAAAAAAAHAAAIAAAAAHAAAAASAAAASAAAARAAAAARRDTCAKDSRAFPSTPLISPNPKPMRLIAFAALYLQDSTPAARLGCLILQNA
ncbi:hypothetical protein GQ54DRAFT_305109 [Martensiomyces pterosporus]|nr:hypothetical protein GQ54DRAFT_305109 [Martensiomyces pterosporus]